MNFGQHTVRLRAKRIARNLGQAGLNSSVIHVHPVLSEDTDGEDTPRFLYKCPVRNNNRITWADVLGQRTFEGVDFSISVMTDNNRSQTRLQRPPALKCQYNEFRSIVLAVIREIDHRFLGAKRRSWFEL